LQYTKRTLEETRNMNLIAKGSFLDERRPWLKVTPHETGRILYESKRKLIFSRFGVDVVNYGKTPAGNLTFKYVLQTKETGATNDDIISGSQFERHLASETLRWQIGATIFPNGPPYSISTSSDSAVKRTDIVGASEVLIGCGYLSADGNTIYTTIGFYVLRPTENWKIKYFELTDTTEVEIPLVSFGDGRWQFNEFNVSELKETQNQ
ncbi:MAG: hypothetical protein AAF217_11330, partial [Pseudomonadota bacterium]